MRWKLSLGARLFERSRSGYKPTDAGALLLEQARRMADQAEEIERRVLGRDRELTGPLRLATAFVVMEHLLPRPLADFARAYPGIEVEVVENAFLVDLARRQAEEAPGPTHDCRPTWRCACRPTCPSTWSAGSSG
jgi:DNA-binding transcriptional LysR family regulator